MKIVKSMLVFLLTVLIETSVYACYTGISSYTSSLSIAKPVITVSKGKMINITNDVLSGSYEFTVENFNSKGIVSDVEITYYLEVVYTNSKYKNMKIVRINDDNSEEELELINKKSKQFVLKAGEKKSDRYRFYIEYEDDSETISTSLSIRVNVVQSEVN